jgi:hypothetical protein
MMYSQQFKDDVLAAFPKGHNHHEYLATALEQGNPFVGRILDDTNKSLYNMWWDEYQPQGRS